MYKLHSVLAVSMKVTLQFILKPFPSEAIPLHPPESFCGFGTMEAHQSTGVDYQLMCNVKLSSGENRVTPLCPQEWDGKPDDSSIVSAWQRHRAKLHVKVRKNGEQKEK